MSSLLITVKSARTGTDLADRVSRSVTSPHGLATILSNFFAAASGGMEACAVDVQTASADPVAATGTITLTYASMANLDTLTVAGVTLTCVTGTPSGAQFKKEVDGPTTAVNLAALINANATTSKYVYATAASSVVTITALVKAAIGNLVALVSSNGTGAAVSAATLAGGAGGVTVATAPLTYTFGI